MSRHDHASPVATVMRGLASIAWFGVMAVAWLAMVIFAVVMLAVMVVSDMAAHLRSALHLGPAPAPQRASYRIASIF